MVNSEREKDREEILDSTDETRRRFLKALLVGSILASPVAESLAFGQDADDTGGTGGKGRKGKTKGKGNERRRDDDDPPEKKKRGGDGV